MVKNKIYIILIGIIVIFFVVMFLVFGTKNIKEENVSEVLIVGDDSVWKYSDKKWYNITYKSSLQQLSWKKYKVFSNNELIGNYYLWYSDKWYVFDNDKQAVKVEGDLFAYSSAFDLKVKNFTMENVDDFEYVNYVLESNNISTSSKFTSIYKVDFDFDNDSNKETFYLISNAFPLDFEPEKSFSIAFMVKGDTIYYIYKDIASNKGFNGCKPFYNTFLDVNDDNIYEFILSCSDYSVSKRVDMLYQFSDDSFKIAISNQ